MFEEIPRRRNVVFRIVIKMDSEDKKGGGHQLIQVQLISVMSSSSNLQLLCICSGLEIIKNSETCWSSVEKSETETVLKLLPWPNFALECLLIYTVPWPSRGFTQHLLCSTGARLPLLF